MKKPQEMEIAHKARIEVNKRTGLSDLKPTHVEIPESSYSWYHGPTQWHRVTYFVQPRRLAGRKSKQLTAIVDELKPLEIGYQVKGEGTYSDHLQRHTPKREELFVSVRPLVKQRGYEETPWVTRKKPQLLAVTILAQKRASDKPAKHLLERNRRKFEEADENIRKALLTAVRKHLGRAIVYQGRATGVRYD